jgi:hypothetical protein
MSTRSPSRPTTRSTHRPSTAPLDLQPEPDEERNGSRKVVDDHADMVDSHNRHGFTRGTRRGQTVLARRRRAISATVNTQIVANLSRSITSGDSAVSSKPEWTQRFLQSISAYRRIVIVDGLVVALLVALLCAGAFLATSAWRRESARASARPGSRNPHTSHRRAAPTPMTVTPPRHSRPTADKQRADSARAAD